MKYQYSVSKISMMRADGISAESRQGDDGVVRRGHGDARSRVG
jgi:hypothetical protein